MYFSLVDVEPILGLVVAEMYAASVHENPPFMVMQFIKNGTVHEYLARYPDGNRAQLVGVSPSYVRVLLTE